jgi:two-component system alkaline phosphatase synthesis response regulator PhoP
MRETILCVEDEADILEVIEYNLKREGYRVLLARTGTEGLERVRRDNPDIVLLDLMLPGVDGLEVCRRMKEDPLTRPIPVVMVTAKGEESDVVLGLGLGADDYVTKPFSPRELVARVRSVLRRGPLKEERGAGERVVRDGVVIDASRHELRVDDRIVPITATEMRLLHHLARHPGRVFTRDQLLSRVIGDHAIVIDRNIDVHVGAIRRKLDAHRDLIETVRGVGYRFKDLEE